MKIRTDFVTNSSSSSFVLAYKSEEDALYEICRLFAEGGNDDTYGHTAESLGRCLFDLMNSRHHMTAEQVRREYEMRYRYLVEMDVMDDKKAELGMNREEFDAWMAEHGDEISEKVDEILGKQLKEIEEKIGDKEYIVKVTYEDSYPDGLIYELVRKAGGLVAILDMH